MKQFISQYFLYLILFFALFYAPTNSVSIMLNEAQNNLTLYGLDMFLQPHQRKGVDIWINPHYKIVITQACNGMIPILFLYASIWAFPSKISHKFLWMFLGYILFFVVNIVRILWVVYVTENGTGHGDFYWSHDIIGNILLLLTGLGLFIAFIKTIKSKNL